MKYLLILILPFFCFSQEIVVKGKVVDYGKIGMSGVDVINLTTKDSVYTNFDGDYKIRASIGDSLKFSFKCSKTEFKLVESEVLGDVTLFELSYLKEQECKSYPRKLYVFVGKLLSFNSFYEDEDCEMSIDKSSESTYKIIENLYGDYDKEKITFKAYEHARSIPFNFKNTKYALLFVSTYCNENYLIRYQFYNVYKTKNKRYAIRFLPKDYNKNDTLIMKPEAIDFGELSFKLNEGKENSSIQLLSPYYEVRSKKIIPIKGNYVEDVFDYWKTQEWTQVYFKN